MDIYLLTDNNAGYTWVKDILQVVLIPIILAIVAIFFPRRWQVRQRDFETKTQLITEISEKVMSTVMTLFNNKTAPPLDEKNVEFRNDDIRDAYNRWKIDTCVIGSKIHAFFPVTKGLKISLHKRWLLFSNWLEKYYIKWQEEFDIAHIKAWEKEKDRLFSEKARINFLVLSSRINGFNSSDPELAEKEEGASIPKNLDSTAGIVLQIDKSQKQ